MKWREEVEGNIKKIGLRKDAADRCRWRKGVGELLKKGDASGHLHSLGIFNRNKIGLLLFLLIIRVVYQ